MIWIGDLAAELQLHRSTVSYWLGHDIDCDPKKTRIKGRVYISDEAADEIRERHNRPSNYHGNKGGSSAGKKDLNYNQKRGLPTRISY